LIAWLGAHSGEDLACKNVRRKDVTKAIILYFKEAHNYLADKYETEKIKS
jgi:hypothetical protein